MASNKLRSHPDAKRSADGIMVRPSALVVDPGWNVRVRDQELEDHINGIAESIKNGGKIPPLQIYVNDDGQIIIVDGHCRNEAIQKAIEGGCEIEWVPVVEFEGNDADRVAFMFTSSQGRGLTQYEQAVAFKRLKNFGWSIPEIAGRVGRSVGFVDKMLKLANADAEVQQMVKSGEVSAGAAVAVLRKEKGKTKEVLKEKVTQAKAKAAKAVAAGKKAPAKVRVTERDVDGIRLPKVFQENLVQFFQSLRDNMGAMVYDEARSLVGMTDDMLEGESAEVGMALIVSLIRIGDEVQRIVAEQE